MTLLVVYLAFLVVIGALDFFRSKGFDRFTVAGRGRSTIQVVFSMLATIVGGSATIGLIERAYTIGFPAFWWLAVGSAGLLAQAVVLSERVRALDAYTLPDVVETTMGKAPQFVTAVIVVLSWIGILAAQFAASAKILSVYLPSMPLNLIVAVCAGAVIAYTAMGGQFSVIKTDFVQFLFIAVSIVVTVVSLLAGRPADSPALHIELFNGQFGAYRFFYLLVIVGGSYFIGPDMFSRLFTSKDAKTAKRASYWSAGILLVLSALIALIGTAARSLLPQTPAEGVIPAITLRLPKAAGILFSFGLLSAILSSADTLLVTIAAIAERNIFRRSNVTAMRIMVVTFGVLGTLLAFYQKNVIGLLLMAFSVYVPGVVPPLFFGIVYHGKRKPVKPLLLLSVLAGGVLGLLSNIIKTDWLALAGTGCSAVMAFAAFIMPKNEK